MKKFILSIILFPTIAMGMNVIEQFRERLNDIAELPSIQQRVPQYKAFVQNASPHLEQVDPAHRQELENMVEFARKKAAVPRVLFPVVRAEDDIAGLVGHVGQIDLNK